MNKNYICCFDTETTSKDPSKAHILEIAAVIIDPRELVIVDGGEFKSFMKPDVPSDDPSIEEEALRVNNIKREDIDGFPSSKTVWLNFNNFVSRYVSGRSGWGSPIAAGHNIIGYDIPIIRRYAEKYNTKYCFHPRDVIDTMHLSFYWLENCSTLNSYSMDNLRKHLGMPENTDDGLAHTALRDVKDCATLLSRFLRFHRSNAKNKKYFEGAFSNA